MLTPFQERELNMKIVKMLALVSVVAVGFVGASVTMGEDVTPVAPTLPAVTSTNVCSKCSVTMDKCVCKKHHKRHKKDAAASTNCTDKAISGTNCASTATDK